jgi:hypothetical protein
VTRIGNPLHYLEKGLCTICMRLFELRTQWLKIVESDIVWDCSRVLQKQTPSVYS